MHQVDYKHQQMHFDFMNVISLHSDHWHVSATHVAIFRVVRETVQIYLNVLGSLHGSNRTVLANIPVKWWNSDEYKISEVTNCCLQCGSVEWRAQKGHVVDCDPDCWAMIQSSFLARPITRSHDMWPLCVGSLKNYVYKTDNPQAAGTLQRLTTAAAVRSTSSSF